MATLVHGFKVLIVCTPSAMFEATALGFMLAATDDAAPVCSTADQVKGLLIAVQELHVWPIQIYTTQTIRWAYGLQETGKHHFI
jgi:hypothetical protein